jgi:hypothetical protein
LVLPKKQEWMDMNLSSGTVSEYQLNGSFLLPWGILTLCIVKISPEDGSYFELVKPPKPGNLSEDEQLANAVADSVDQGMEQKYSDHEKGKS